MKRTMILFLIAALLLSGCGMIPPTDSLDTSAPETTDPSSAATVPTSTGPLLAKDYLEDPNFAYFDTVADYEVIIPEDGVLIFTEQEALEEVFIVGDVYITATADVSLHNVYVSGKVYCHGTLQNSGFGMYPVFAYYTTSIGYELCSAYDGVHGRFVAGANKGGRCTIANDALDYAFEKWGNFGPSAEHPDLTVSQKVIEPQIIQHGDNTKLYPDTYVFTGEGLVSDKKFYGDVYITADSLVEFRNVSVFGDIYCYGQLKLTKRASHLPGYVNNNTANTIYAYSFHESCDSFDGVHGLIVGGPINCKNIVISDDALDYAFDTFGKQ